MNLIQKYMFIIFGNYKEHDTKTPNCRSVSRNSIPCTIIEHIITNQSIATFSPTTTVLTDNMGLDVDFTAHEDA